MSKTTENTQVVIDFINSMNENIENARGEAYFGAAISTSMAWISAATYNGSRFDLEAANAHMVELQDKKSPEDIIEKQAEYIRDLEKRIDESKEAYGYWLRFTEFEYDEINKLNPTPEAIIEKFGYASDDIEDYKPTQEALSYLKSKKRMTEKKLNKIVNLKANQDMAEAMEMAKWSHTNRDKFIKDLRAAYDKCDSDLEMDDETTLSVLERIQFKLDDYIQRGLLAMLNKSSKYARAAMANDTFFEKGLETIEPLIDRYKARASADEANNDPYAIH